MIQLRPRVFWPAVAIIWVSTIANFVMLLNGGC